MYNGWVRPEEHRAINLQVSLTELANKYPDNEYWKNRLDPRTEEEQYHDECGYDAEQEENDLLINF